MQDFDMENQLAQQRYQQALAAQQKAGQMPQGKMVGNQYVRAHPMQYLSEMLRSYNVGQEKRGAEQELKDLSGKRQTAIADALRTYGDKMQGAPAFEAAGPMPEGNAPLADPLGLDGGKAAPSGGYQVPARAPDAMGAYTGLMQAPDASLRAAGMKGMMEQQAKQAALAQQQQYMDILQKAQSPQQALAAGVPYETAKQFYESQNLGKTEVGRTEEIEGPGGVKMLQRFDKFGAPIGQPMPGYMAAQAVNTGNKTIFAKPVAGQSFNMGMSPGESARLAQSERQFNITQNQPVFNADAGGFVYKPTASAPQGGVVKVEGVGNKPLNESQGNATMFGLRMAEADKILAPLENAGVKDTGKIRAGVSGTLGAIPLIGDSLRGGSDNVFNALPSIMGGLSQDQQSALNARVNFVTAVLRKESGAAISPGEFATAEKLYFPAPGDGPQIIKQKQAARQQAITGIKAQAGPGAKNIEAGMPGATPAGNAPTSSGW